MPTAIHPDTPSVLPRHVPALDAVRGLAIIAVTLFRFREVETADWAANLLRIVLGRGVFGVDLFFVLSGFLITGILFDAKDRPHYFRNFYIRRTLRIFPLYYASLVLGLLILPALLPPGGSELATRPPYSGFLWVYGANLVQSWTNTWPLGAYNHFWSLAVEEHFYFAWPCVIFLTNRQLAMRVCVACIGIGIITKVALIAFADATVAAEVFTLSRLDALGIGSWLALKLRGPDGLDSLIRLRWPIAWAAALSIVGLLAANRLLYETHPIESKMLYFVAYTPIAVLFGAGMITAVTVHPASVIGRIANSRWLQLAGKYSYGWYVFQGLIVLDLKRYLPSDLLLSWCGGSGLLALLVNIFIGSGLSLLLAVISWHILEKPLLSLKDRFTTNPPPS